ncbi:MAG TPA: hypothetical protein VFF31_26450 [Blastocatellia bacterium]|nr:hypothetical protein [Blastocatellia bacterium]
MMDPSADGLPSRYLRRGEAARYVAETWGIACTPNLNAPGLSESVIN